MPGKRRAAERSPVDAVPRQDWCSPREDLLECVWRVYPEGIGLDPADNLTSITNAYVSIMLPDLGPASNGAELKHDTLGPHIDQVSFDGEVSRVYYGSGLGEFEDTGIEPTYSWATLLGLHIVKSPLSYINFPYGRSTSPRWSKKCRQEAEAGCDVMVLGPSAPGTKWFRNFWVADAIAFPDRLRFLGAPYKADFESFVAYWGPRVHPWVYPGSSSARGTVKPWPSEAISFREAFKDVAVVTKSGGIHPPGEV